MKKIKTIANKTSISFDNEVNQAIANGWTLVRRYYTTDGYFVAEMERVVMLSCEICKHFAKGYTEEPCLYCANGAGKDDKWEKV